MPLPTDQKTSPLSKLLAVFGIKPRPAFKPYDQVISHPFVKGETLTLHHDKPGSFTFDHESVFGEKSRAAFAASRNEPAAPKP